MNYAGAQRPLSRSKASRLGSGWVIQPKLDGCYARIVLDGGGRITQLSSRSGRPFGCDSALSLLGVHVGQGDSVLHGEIETQTEWSQAQVKTRGYANLHIFDAERVGGRNISSKSYLERRDCLMKVQAELQASGVDRPWWTDARGCVHHERNGRFCRAIPRGWKRAQVVEQLPISQLSDVWSQYVEREQNEGLVLVNLRSRFAAKGSKYKLKRTETVDAKVVRAEGKRLWLNWYGVEFGCPLGKWAGLAAGDVVEVACNGMYESMIPRHPRVIRVRGDLM